LAFNVGSGRVGMEEKEGKNVALCNAIRLKTDSHVTCYIRLKMIAYRVLE